MNAIAQDAVNELAPVIGISKAAPLFGLSRSQMYYQPKQKDQHNKRGGGLQPNALNGPERSEILSVLHSSQYIDDSPYEVYASLLDNGHYLASISSMYRILRENGETMPRSSQRKAQEKRPIPVLCATKPNEIWSWDISPICTFVKRRFFYLYAIIDLYSRFVPGWCVEEVEDKDLARELFDRTCTEQGITKGTLTLHSDNGPQMRSDAMNEFMAIAGITKSRSRPHVSNDNPYSESLFKTAKYVPTYPGSFATIENARLWFNTFFSYYNHEHYHFGLGLFTPSSVHNGTIDEIVILRQQVLDNAYEAHPKRFINGKPLVRTPEPAWINRPASSVPERVVAQ